MSHLLEVRGLSKAFFGSPVLRGVDLDVRAGEVHGLVGENGAGKSTLMKILAGVYTPDAGEVRIDGRPVEFSHPLQAYAAGVSTVFQEFTLLADRTVAENIYLGREPRRGVIVSRQEMNRRTSDLLTTLDVESIDPASMVRDLSVAQQQIVEIAKALSYDARVISMDEPTAALAGREVEMLYRIVRRLTERGVAILYVSHRLREIFDLCDRVTVLKDGALVDTRPAADLSQAELVRLMVGRPLSSFFPEKDAGTTPGEVVLSLHGAGNSSVDGIDLDLRRGEIVGMAGLQGAGRTEVLEGIAGARAFLRGTMRVQGRTARIARPGHAIRRGIAYITEDRKSSGLALSQSVIDNALTLVRAVRPHRTKASRTGVASVFHELDLAARGPDQEVRFLSGGNQQKVVLAKWLLLDPDIVLLDEPTRGIDVGAKHAVYTVMRRLAAAGCAILMVSSEMPELIGMSDRIVVMHDGRLVAELPGGSSEESIMAAASGMSVRETLT